VTSNAGARTWWAETYSIGAGSAGYWRIGSLELRIARSRHEWLVEWNHLDESRDPPMVVEVPTARPSIGSGGSAGRFGFQGTDGALRLAPRLADRAFVINPAHSLSIPEQEEISIFVSTPVWVSIRAGSAEKKLMDLPAFRASDTWFGASSIEGELCYASKTRARLHYDTLEFRSHRAITKVRIVNHSNALLRFENLKLPVPMLSLFEDGHGWLWTNTVDLVCEETGAMATQELGVGPPQEARAARTLSVPPQPPQQSLLTRAFGELIR
jgi:hypothetical protein